MGETYRGYPGIVYNSSYDSGSPHKTLQNPHEVLGLTNQPHRRRGGPGGELTPRLFLTCGAVPPDARVRYHAEELVAAGPGNGPGIVAFHQIAYDRRCRIVVPRFATVCISQQIRVNGPSPRSRLSVNHPSEVLPRVRLQMILPARSTNAVVGQPVTSVGGRSGQYLSQPLFDHGTQRASRTPCMPLRAQQQFILDVKRCLHNTHASHTVSDGQSKS